MSGARWIEESERKTNCARCKSVIEQGERFYYQKRGTYLCELCGSLAEGEEPEVGEMEQSVLEDLRGLPDEAGRSSLGQSMIHIARQLDNGDVATRDTPAYVKELRQNLAALKTLYPPVGDDDGTDQARKSREAILGGEFEER